MSHRFRSAMVLALIACAGVPAAAQAKAKSKTKAKPDITVMSRNLYLGADIIKLATAPDAAAEQQSVADLYNTVKATNFPLRAKVIAKEIKKTSPDIIGLQEVTKYRRGPDGVHDAIKNASTVLYDYVPTLLKEVKALGLSYKVVSQQTEIDVEVPSAEGYDLRLTLGNAVLVRTGTKARVRFTKNLHGIFSQQLKLALPDQAVTLSRGYAGMQGVVAGRTFRFLDPHAEAYGADIAEAQMKQLTAASGAGGAKKVPTIMAGDFNSDPASVTTGGAYNAVIAAGYVDTGKRALTCCQDEKLDNPVSKLGQWIDHIVARPKVKVLRSQIVGNKPSDRIGGLWPSDHAGVVATLRLLK